MLFEALTVSSSSLYPHISGPPMPILLTYPHCHHLLQVAADCVAPAVHDHEQAAAGVTCQVWAGFLLWRETKHTLPT
jgi:hypothetical protein